MRRRPVFTRGFTLVELVTVMVLLGIAVVGLSTLLGNMSGIYLQSAQREQLLGQSRFVLERLNRELRDAVPNSLRVSNSGSWSCLEFVPFSAVVRYRTIALQPDTLMTMDVVSLDATFTAAAGQWLLVYPTSPADIYAASSQKVQLHNTPLLNDSDGKAVTYRLQLSQAFGFGTASPATRAYLLNSPVSFCALGNEIRRYEGYGLQSSQPVPGSGLSNGALMARQISNNLASQPVFELAADTLTRNSLVQIQLELTSEQDSGTVLSYSHLVQVSNVP
ncbi:PilW family protein [Rheinheimera texasensis]|uniref:PilW family protein n=1 Tax=Rheinheimera texasensis TaxID=306205 RepID=UPI0004E11828|nr:prepilin-type N-terminal cleavage/methylation domain-containing protein [Rheinheimera texasensis]